MIHLSQNLCDSVKMVAFDVGSTRPLFFDNDHHLQYRICIQNFRYIDVPVSV